MENNQQQVIYYNNKVYYIPVQFKDVYELMNSRDFNEYVQLQLEKTPKENILDRYSKFFNSTIIMGESRSMMSYVPEFLDHLKSLERDEKLNKLLGDD
jgi:hypothetical protein